MKKNTLHIGIPSSQNKMINDIPFFTGFEDNMMEFSS